MTKRITHKVLLLCLALAVPACGGDSGRKDDKQAAKAGKKKADAGAAKKADAAKPDPDGPKPSMDSPEGRVALAALVATEIAESPDKADDILTNNGLDRDKLDELMYEIARDPDLSKAYKERRMNG